MISSDTHLIARIITYGGRDGGNTARIKTRIKNIISMEIFKRRDKMRENNDKVRKK
jgi:hypothetical protein